MLRLLTLNPYRDSAHSTVAVDQHPGSDNTNPLPACALTGVSDIDIADPCDLISEDFTVGNADLVQPYDSLDSDDAENADSHNDPKSDIENIEPIKQF
jgi:hypothetical protein